MHRHWQSSVTTVSPEENGADNRAAVLAAFDSSRQCAEKTQRHQAERDCSSAMSGSRQHLLHIRRASESAPVAPERLTGKSLPGPFSGQQPFPHAARHGSLQTVLFETHARPHARESDSGFRTTISAEGHAVDIWCFNQSALAVPLQLPVIAIVS